MASRKLHRMGLNDKITENLCLSKVTDGTCNGYFAKSSAVLGLSLDLNKENVDEITLQVSKKIIPRKVTALSILQDRNASKLGNFLETELPSLDNTMKGIATGSITEIVGSPNSGKTQLCHMLAVLCVTKWNCGVIYIDIEHSFNPDRIIEIAKSRYPELYNDFESNDDPEAVNERIENLLNSIDVYTPDTCQTLTDLLTLSLEDSIIQGKKKLLILDSIFKLPQKDFPGNTSIMKRQEHLMNQASQLKRLADSYNIIVLITNQIKRQYHQEQHMIEKTTDGINETHSRNTEGLLGNTWHHCVSSRLIMKQKHIIPVNGNSNNDNGIAELTLVKSPLSRNITVSYVICNRGIVEL